MMFTNRPCTYILNVNENNIFFLSFLPHPKSVLLMRITCLRYQVSRKKNFSKIVGPFLPPKAKLKPIRVFKSIFPSSFAARIHLCLFYNVKLRYDFSLSFLTTPPTCIHPCKYSASLLCQLFSNQILHRFS